MNNIKFIKYVSMQIYYFQVKITNISNKALSPSSLF